MPDLLLFNKPYGVLCQFSPDDRGSPLLADYIKDKGFYPAGRLDKDSEGLLLLTNDGALQAQISHPRHKMKKTYWVQVEGVPDKEQLAHLRQGVVLKDGITRPAAVKLIDCPLPARNPPVRYRKTVKDSWIELTISEGRNRQVRRMTAAVGLPTLRLYRYRVGSWSTEQLNPGEYQRTSVNLPRP